MARFTCSPDIGVTLPKNTKYFKTVKSHSPCFVPVDHISLMYYVINSLHSAILF